jgi:hypothetical protein
MAAGLVELRAQALDPVVFWPALEGAGAGFDAADALSTGDEGDGGEADGGVVMVGFAVVGDV